MCSDLHINDYHKYNIKCNQFHTYALSSPPEPCLSGKSLNTCLSNLISLIYIHCHIEELCVYEFPVHLRESMSSFPKIFPPSSIYQRKMLRRSCSKPSPMVAEIEKYNIDLLFLVSCCGCGVVWQSTLQLIT